MILLKPTTTKFNLDTNLTSFWFDPDFHQEVRDLFVRGAIAWPEDKRLGFAILCGQDVEKKIVYCFEEMQFMTIPPLIVENDKVAQRGLGQWLMDMWAKYHCRTYYCHQNDEIHRRYSLQVYADKTIKPNPRLIDVPTVDRLGDSLLRETMLRGGFIWDVRSIILHHVGQHLQNPDAKNPELGVHALRCLLVGLEHAGYRKPQDEQREKIEWLGRLEPEGFRAF